MVVFLAKIPSLWIYEKKPSSVFSDNKIIHLQGKKNPNIIFFFPIFSLNKEGTTSTYGNSDYSQTAVPQVIVSWLRMGLWGWVAVPISII